MIDRRAFLAALFAPFVAGLSKIGYRARPAAGLSLAELDSYTRTHIIPALTDNIYGASPLFVRLRGIQEGAPLPAGANRIPEYVWRSLSPAMRYRMRQYAPNHPY